MKLNSWGILAFFGSLIFLVLFIKDWETKMDAEKLSRMNLPHHSGLDADPNLNLVSEHLKSAFSYFFVRKLSANQKLSSRTCEVALRFRKLWRSEGVG
jgi:hypothetical protein